MCSDRSEGEQQYCGSITALDEQVRRLRSRLRAPGVAGTTMLWNCNGNAPEVRTPQIRNNHGSSEGLRGRKRSLIEGGLRMPGILGWPNRVEAGRSTPVPGSTSDFFPTVSSALGLEVRSVSRTMDAVNVMPLIEGKMQRWAPRTASQTPDGGERGKESRLGSRPDRRPVQVSFLPRRGADRGAHALRSGDGSGRVAQHCRGTALAGSVREERTQGMGCVVLSKRRRLGVCGGLTGTRGCWPGHKAAPRYRCPDTRYWAFVGRLAPAECDCNTVGGSG